MSSRRRNNSNLKNNDNLNHKRLVEFVIVTAILAGSAIAILGLQSSTFLGVNSNVSITSASTYTNLIPQANAQMASSASTNTTSASTATNSNVSSTLSTALAKLQEQARMETQQQNMIAMNLSTTTKQKAREVSNDVLGVLVYYARATGERFPETNIKNANASATDVTISMVPIARIDSAINKTGSAAGVKIVSASDYLIAQALATKAVDTFTSVAADTTGKSSDPATMQALANTQQSLSLLYTAVTNRAGYSFVEDIATSAVNPNLQHMFSAIATSAT